MKRINEIRVGIQILGDNNWPAGVNYVESLVKAVHDLPKEERPQLYLAVFEPMLHAVNQHESILSLLDGIIFVGQNLERAKVSIHQQFLHLPKFEDIFSAIDFFYPVNSDVLPDVCSASWIPDFQHIHLPDFFSPGERQSRDTRYQKIAQHAKLVVFSSDDSRNDFLRLFPRSEAHTRVLSFHSQFPDEWYAVNPSETQKKYDLPDDFLLCSNQFWIHKNHPRLFEALTLLHQKGKDVHLVCTGSAAEHRAPNYFFQLQQMIISSGIEDLVYILGVIPRKDQIQLMRRALAVVQPSLFEGWSTVVEDARALGKTIILSDLPVHYEQAPPHGIFFDRTDSRILADTIEETLPKLTPGPDAFRETEARKEQKAMSEQFARTFCDIVQEGVSLFEKPEIEPETEPISGNIDVSFILATKNRSQLLDEMLASLKKAAEGVRYEVIVIEGNSTDNTLEILNKHGIRQIYNETECLGEGKHSWPRLYNFGFSKTRGKWAMYASDDIVFHEGCITKAVEILNRQPPEVAGGVFFYRNMVAGQAWKDFGIDFIYGQKLLLNYGLIKLVHFKEVNGLHEDYRFYHADSDLCLKLYEKGKQLVPLQGCFVSHINFLDMNKKANFAIEPLDMQLYLGRWRHFVTIIEPVPRRLLWDEFLEMGFSLPSHMPHIDAGIEYFWHGLAFYQQGSFHEAADRFQQAATTSCRHWIILWYFANALFKIGDIHQASEVLRLVIQASPFFQPAANMLGKINENLSAEQAVLFERLQKDFRDVPSLIGLAEIEIQHANKKKAHNYLLAALALEPQNIRAQELLAELRE